MCCDFAGCDRSLCSVCCNGYRLDGLDSLDTSGSVPFLFGSGASMLAVPLFHGSLFGLDAHLYGDFVTCIEGNEIYANLVGAASLCSKILELFSILDCCCASGFMESLVAQRYSNPGVVGVSSMSCYSVDESNVPECSSGCGSGCVCVCPPSECWWGWEHCTRIMSVLFALYLSIAERP